MCGIPVQAWSLIGVALGFSLGEGSRWVRKRLRIRKLKGAVRTELKVILAQIEDKEDILKQAIKALEEKRVLPMAAVRFITTGYGSYIEDLYEHYSDVDRNCLHVIYERLRISDSLTESFFEEFQRAIKDKILDEPWKAYIAHLGELAESYKVVRSLISSFLVGKAEDVFHITGKKNGS
jgi:hypothetical protein